MKELDHRNEVDSAAKLFSELNIASIGKKKLNNLEWSGKLDSDKVYLDSDDDDEQEVDPLKIVASSTEGQKERLVKVEKEETLITQEDLEEIKSFQVSESVIEEVGLTDKSKLEKLLKNNQVENDKSQSELLEPYGKFLCEKEFNSHPNANKYLPFKTTKSNVHDPEKEKHRKVGKHWEITAATPPPIQHNGVKMLSLQESIEIGSVQREIKKEAMTRHAEDRLAMKLERQRDMERDQDRKRDLSTDSKVSNSSDAHANLVFQNYRDILEEDDSDPNSEETEEPENEDE